jgi:ribosomal protein S18 acetylase RimI-like enzyme
VEVRPYIEEDLDGVLALCRAEGWPSLPSDPERAARILTNPGVTTYVAADGGRVVGFAYLLSDGAVQAYLASMAVAADHRRQGLGTRLIQAAFAACGAEWLDLLSDADEFYAQLVHHRWSGFRLYPPFARGPA